MNDRKINIVENIEWQPTNRRYVCFLDIMGFKDMVATRKHSDIYEMMRKIVKFQEINATVNWNDNPCLVKTTTYSDSIIIYSADDSSESLIHLICTVSGLTYDLITEGIPFKGAIALGEMTCDTDNSIYFGQPLIDAFLLQEELHFYGIIVHGSAHKNVEALNDVYVYEYCCPLKKGRASHLTITPMHLVSSWDKGKGLKLFKAVNNMKHITSGHLRVYIESTADYFTEVASSRKSKH